MKKKTKFFLITIWIFLTRGIDLYATAKFTPYLSREGNPLVSVGGLSWTPLIIIIICLVAYSIYALYISTFKNYDVLPTEKGLNFGDFFAFIHLGKKGHWTSVLYRLPSDIMRWTQIVGYLSSTGLVFAGLATTLMWIMIYYIPGFYESYYNLNAIYSIILIGSIAIWTNYYRGLFKKYIKLV